MRRVPRAPLFACAALAALTALACSEAPADLAPGRSPTGPPTSDAAPAARTAAPDRLARIRDEHLPNVSLVTHEGRRVRFYDDLVRGQVVVVSFLYAGCERACPPALRHLAEARRELFARGYRDVRFLSITLDPERDGPAQLAALAREHGSGPGWIFLTGARDDIERLRRALGAFDRDPAIDADLSQHSGLAILGNEPVGRWKAISALSKPVRIRQAIERTLLPPSRWPTGEAVVGEAPYELRESTEPVDLAALPALE